MRQVTHALLTRPPLSHSSLRRDQSASFDLHVLSTPPAFILSQDQTLMLKFDSEPEQQLAVFVPVRFYFWFVFLKILLEFSGLFYCSIINVLLLLFFNSFNRLSHSTRYVKHCFLFFSSCFKFLLSLASALL